MYVRTYIKYLFAQIVIDPQKPVKENFSSQASAAISSMICWSHFHQKLAHQNGIYHRPAFWTSRRRVYQEA